MSCIVPFHKKMKKNTTHITNCARQGSDHEEKDLKL